MVLTSDHGAIRVQHGVLVHADRETSTNLRYKYGRAIRAESKQVMGIDDPEAYGLPALKLSTNYLIAQSNTFFVYPNHFHHFNNLYKDSLQHGGISLEEMVLPVVTLEPVRGGGSG